MFEAFFTDPCMRYRTEVINGIDFYGLGFSMVRGECVAEGTLRWMQEGEAAAVLITNTSLPAREMMRPSGFNGISPAI